MNTVNPISSNNATKEGHLLVKMPTFGLSDETKLAVRDCVRGEPVSSPASPSSLSLRASSGVCSDVRDECSLDVCDLVERVDAGRDDDRAGESVVLYVAMMAPNNENMTAATADDCALVPTQQQVSKREKRVCASVLLRVETWAVAVAVGMMTLEAVHQRTWSGKHA